MSNLHCSCAGVTRADGISVREVSAAAGVTRSIHPVLLAACVLGCVGVGVLPNCVGVLHCVGSDVQAVAEDRMYVVELARTTPAQL